MIFDRLRVFVSSSMAELGPERLTVKAALAELNVDAWVYEQDAGARPVTPWETFRSELEVFLDEVEAVESGQTVSLLAVVFLLVAGVATGSGAVLLLVVALGIFILPLAPLLGLLGLPFGILYGLRAQWQRVERDIRTF